MIRRKLAVAQRAEPPTGGAERQWPLALARAARDTMALVLEVPVLEATRRSLAELLDLAPERALVLVLEGPAEGLGVMMIAPPVLAALIEAQTMGRVQTGPALPRRATRTDAAMVAGFIDAALTGLEAALAAEEDLIWAGGFRYASFLDDPRP
ncbi:MAG TPA: flagellar motor switch protein FliM, partial [Paracoccaceae bacterium]